MSAPELVISFGFGSTWTTEDASISWEDITGYVHQPSGFSSDRGRSYETDEERAGTCSFRLNNEDRRFDPTHAAGPYFGDLKPGVPVKIEAVADGNTEPLYRGFAEGWPQDYALGNTYAWTDVRCTDGFGKLASAGLPSSVYAIEVAADDPAGWWRLSETSDPIAADSSGNDKDITYTPGTTTLSGSHPSPWETVSAIQFDGEHAASGIQVFDWPAGLPRVECIFIRDDSSATEVGFRLGDFGKNSLVEVRMGAVVDGRFSLTLDGTASMGSTTVGDITAGEPHHLFARAGLGGWTIYLDGEDAGGTHAATAISDDVVGVCIGARKVSGTIDLGFTGTLADVVTYDTAITNDRVVDHADAFRSPWDGDTSGERIARLLDAAGWPSDLRAVATGLSSLGPAVLGGFALQGLKRAQGAEQGRMFIARNGDLTFLDRYYLATETAGTTSQATFSDDGSDNAYSALGFDYDLSLVKNRVRASRRGGGEVEVSDATSIADYGDRSDTDLTELDFTSDHQARSAAEFRLANYREPANRVRPVTVKLHGLPPTQQAELLALELGYRVTIERTPQGIGDPITDECSIEGISHQVSNGAWEMTLRLAPVPDHMEAVGLWGTGEWDTAEWAY